MKLIQNNPFRFLGVCSNAPMRERVANANRLKAYLKVGKEVSLPLDLNGLLPAIARTAEGLDAANNSINLPKDQLKYALFWFIKASEIDKMALEYLQNGNADKAAEIFSKKTDFSSLVNRGVLAFITGNDGLGISSLTQVIHNGGWRESFIEAVCGSTFQMTEDELAELFVDCLLEELPAGQLCTEFEQNCQFESDKTLVRDKAVGQHINAINSAIAEAKKADVDNSAAQHAAGTKLMTSTKAALQAVRSILGTGNMQYQMLADNLAKQILQCGINYINNSDEDEETRLKKAYKIQNYALSIAVGQLVKDRCKENVDILNNRKASLPPSIVKEEDKIITAALTDFCKKPDLICHAVTLLNICKPQLKLMKDKLGATNAYYVKISTLVAANALHNLIEEVNAAQDDPNIKYKMQLGLSMTDSDLYKLKETVRSAWNCTLMMDNMEKDAEFSTRFRENRSALWDLYNNLGLGGRGTGGSGGSGGSGNSDSGWSGCLGWIILVIIFACIRSCG